MKEEEAIAEEVEDVATHFIEDEAAEADFKDIIIIIASIRLRLTLVASAIIVVGSITQLLDNLVIIARQ